VAVALLVAVAGAGFYLSIYLFRPVEGPIGWDTTQYAWRAELVQEEGLAGLPTRLGSGLPVKQGRPAFPVLAGTLGGLQGGATPLAMSAALPLALAVAVGLAGGAVAARAYRTGAVGLAALALVVVVSPNVILMMQYAYIDNLVVSAVFLAAIVGAAAALEHRRALVAAIALHGVAGLAHAPFLALTVPALGGAGLLLLPRSVRERRAGRPVLDTATARALLVAAAGALLAYGLVRVLGTGLPTPQLVGEGFSARLDVDLPHYRLLIAVPAAVAGAWLAFRRGGGAAAAGALSVVVSSAGVGLLSVGLLLLTPIDLPANRAMAFALGLPILVGVAALGASERAGRVNRPMGAAVLAVAVAGIGLLGAYQWVRTPPQTSPQRLRDAAEAGVFLEQRDVPPGRPVIFVVDDRSANPEPKVPLMMDHLLAGLPPERMDSVHVFLGAPADLVAGRASTVPGHPAYDRASARFLDRLGPALRRNPVSLILPSFNQAHWPAWARSHDASVHGRVGVVEGLPGGRLTTSPEMRSDPLAGGTPRLALLVGGTLLALWVAGAGWARLAFGRVVEPGTVAILAPAVGLAAVLLGGVVADRMGIRLEGWAGGGVTAAVAAAGWAGDLLATRRKARAA
jgi:hypothetical protein